MKSKDSMRYFGFIGYNYMFWLADIFSQPQVSTRVQVYNMYKWVLILLVMKMRFANYIYILFADFHSILLLCSTSSCLFPYNDIWALPNDCHSTTQQAWQVTSQLNIWGSHEKLTRFTEVCVTSWSFLCLCIPFRMSSSGIKTLWQKWCSAFIQLILARSLRISDCSHHKIR